MKQNSTSDLLIQYLYRETSTSETLALHEELLEDPELREEYLGLFKAYQQLPKVKFNPSDESIRNILRYSEETTVKHV